MKGPKNYCLYEDGEAIVDEEHTVFECANWHSIIGMITAAIIVGVMIASRENWASVPNYA